MDKKERIEKIMSEGRRIFLNELESNISNVLEKIMHYSLEDGDQQLEDIRRFFHSLKGTSATLQYDDLSFLGAKYDEYMENIEEADKSIIVSTLINGMGQVKKELERIKKDELLTENSIASPGEDDIKAIKDFKGKILIVDDANLIVKIIETRLNSLGYEVKYANDGIEALEKSKIMRPDLMIVDLMLPKMDGFELCREVLNNNETRNTKIIVLSSKKREEDIVRCFKIGVHDYMTKPFSVEELEHRINRLFEK